MYDGKRRHIKVISKCHFALGTCHSTSPLPINLYNTSTTMGDLSDLDLVAQAMAPTNAPDKSTSAPKSQPSQSTEQSTDKDLSSLTPEDLAMLQPILDALNLGDADDLDDAALHDLIRQMDVAGDVADDLEGKLDKLIGELGKVEEGILADTDIKDTKKDSTGGKEEKETKVDGQDDKRE
jgi:hypothetical protein